MSNYWKGATLFSFPTASLPPPLPATDDHAAQLPRQLRQPKEPTDYERALHNLTHLPFRSWCAICTQAKGRQDHSHTTDKGRIIQVDYNFVATDKRESDKTTLITATDVPTGYAMVLVVPSKGLNHYCEAEFKRFIYELGRTECHNSV